jgi:hypothetical protein
MISIVQAAKASAPYPWAKFAKWMAQQGFTAEETQTMIENGAEPAVIAAVGCTIDEAVTYPGLPSLEGLTLDPEPGISIHGGDLA